MFLKMIPFLFVLFITLFPHFAHALPDECEQVLSEPIEIQLATAEDISALVELDQKAWGPLAATSSKLASRIELFPEGQFKAVSDTGVILGFLNTQKVWLSPEEILKDSEEASIDPYLDWWSFFTDNGFLKQTHPNIGKGLFLVNLTTDPQGKIPRRQIGTQLISAALKFSKEQNLRHVQGLTRVNGFAQYLRKTYPEYVTSNSHTKYQIQKNEIGTYLNLVIEGREKDSALSFHLQQGALIITAVENAMIDDEDSEGWGALISYDHFAQAVQR